MKARNVIISLTTLIVAGGLAAITQASTPQLPDQVGARALGVRYEAPTSAPLVIRSEAIDLAKARLGSRASSAINIQAYHVRFSDDQYFTTDLDGVNHYHFADVSAWVIVFQGVELPSLGGRTATGNSPHNHEIHVVINAVTGEYMELFSYQ